MSKNSVQVEYRRGEVAVIWVGGTALETMATCGILEIQYNRFQLPELELEDSIGEPYVVTLPVSVNAKLPAGPIEEISFNYRIGDILQFAVGGAATSLVLTGELVEIEDVLPGEEELIGLVIKDNQGFRSSGKLHEIILPRMIPE
jgi:hypothetical protein